MPIIEYSTAAPEEECSGKFLQFVWRGKEYLLFAQTEICRYHNQALGRFLKENGIAHHWASDEALEIGDEDLSVVGGGRFRALPRVKRLELWDDSHAYGRFEARGLARKIAASGHRWRSFRVEIS